MEWQDWLEKEDKEIKKKPTMFPRIRREFEDEKDEDPMVYDNKTASWESWLEKTQQSTIPKRVEGGLKNDSEGTDVEGILMGAIEQGDIKARSGIRSKHPYKNRDIGSRSIVQGTGSSNDVEDKDDDYVTNSELSNDKSRVGGERGEGYQNALTLSHRNAKLLKTWESWLEKEEKPKERDYLAEMQTQGEQNMYQNSSKKKKFLKEAKGAGKKIEQQMGENDLPLSYSNRLRTNIKRPAERVTSNDLSDLDGWVEETKSWESWLEKNDPCWEGYEQYGMKDKNGKKVPNCVKKADESKPLNKPMRDDGNKKFKVFVRDPSTGNIVTVRFGDPNMEIKRDNPERRSSFRARHKCSEQKDITSAAYWSCKMWEKTSSVSDNVNKSNWEVWLEKNNAIETSHKEDEKKHEWDGKFSSSTIRDDVKDDDDKAVSEEESLEELTDGKLEEVEKLKSWELWLEKDALDPDSKYKPRLMNTQRFARISTEVRGGNAQGGKLGDASLRGMRAEEKKRGKKYKWKNPDRKGRGGEKKELYHGTERQAGNYPALGTDSGKESGEKFAKLFQEEKKSWELWLEKDSLDGKQSPDGLPKLTAGGKKVEIEAKNVIDRDDRGKKNEMYKSWLEKMQGAGDARFGNQHLTGLDQKPVDNEEDEANILPEKEQKTDNKEEKQEKTEDKEDKDNKPYKALSQE